MTSIGHNSQSGKQLQSIIERVERIEEEKLALSSDIKDILLEAKSAGFDVKAIRQILKIRKLKDQERIEQEMILATYMHALGMTSHQIDMFEGAANGVGGDAAHEDRPESG